jgi:hypothetical protein
MSSMSGSDTSKIERVSAPGNQAVWVDLCLSKRSGMFWARVGDVRVAEKTKELAIEKTREALSRVFSVRWRQVIVVSVPKNRRDGGESNGIRQHRASCSVHYERVERSPSPMGKGAEIERLHPLDFEAKVAEERRDAGSYWGATAGEKKKKRADEAEAALRQARATLAGSHQVFAREDWVEHEIPYSEEAWAGIERIAATLRETQRRLDGFAAEWTTETLALLGTATDPRHGAVALALFLPDPGSKPQRGRRR